MAFVIAKPGESIDSLWKRFKKAVENAGILADLKKHEFYEKPSVKKKRKQAAARKRFLKRDHKFDQQSVQTGTNQNFRWNKDKTRKIPLPPTKPNSNDRVNTNTSAPNRPNDQRYNKNYRGRTDSKNPKDRPNTNDDKSFKNRPHDNRNHKGKPQTNDNKKFVKPNITKGKNP